MNMHVKRKHFQHWFASTYLCTYMKTRKKNLYDMKWSNKALVILWPFCWDSLLCWAVVLLEIWFCRFRTSTSLVCGSLFYDMGTSYFCPGQKKAKTLVYGSIQVVQKKPPKCQSVLFCYNMLTWFIGVWARAYLALALCFIFMSRLRKFQYFEILS